MHAPGPRGSPQRPQPEGAGSDDEVTAFTREKSTRSVDADAHLGHAAPALADVISSKACEHCLQTYS